MRFCEIVFGFLFAERGSDIRRNYPRPEDFSKALYTLDIGQNDITAGLRFMPIDQVKSSISNIIQKLASAIEVTILTNISSFCHLF